MGRLWCPAWATCAKKELGLNAWVLQPEISLRRSVRSRSAWIGAGLRLVRVAVCQRDGNARTHITTGCHERLIA